MRAHVFPGDVASLARLDFPRAITNRGDGPFAFEDTVMTTAADRRDSRRLNQALWLVLRRYGRQVMRRPWLSVPALVLPGIGDVLIFYAPPLVVAQLLGTVARGDALTIGTFAPYV